MGSEPSWGHVACARLRRVWRAHDCNAGSQLRRMRTTARLRPTGPTLTVSGGRLSGFLGGACEVGGGSGEAKAEAGRVAKATFSPCDGDQSNGLHFRNIFGIIAGILFATVSRPRRANMPRGAMERQ